MEKINKQFHTVKNVHTVVFLNAFIITEESVVVTATILIKRNKISTFSIQKITAEIMN